MQRTRRQILDILKRRGRATLEELSKEVGLSPVTIRVHLSVLQRDDLVNVEEVRGRVGRPFFVYSLSQDAEELFPKRYHVLANRLLRSMNGELPAETVQKLLLRIAETWSEEHASRMTGKSFTERIAEVAEIRCEEGAIADWEKVDGGYMLRQYNCPNLLVSRSHKQVCDIEQEYLARLLGASVVRSECIGSGDRTCSYLISERAGG